MRLRDAIRHILLGGLIAAGMGSLSMSIVAHWLKLPPEAVPAGGAAGSAAYLVGVFGPAVIEVTLARIRSIASGEAVPMRELLRLAARLRCDDADPCRRLPPPPAGRPRRRRADPSPLASQVILSMRTTDRGLLALARHEGVVPAPYLDVNRVWTFGVGHTAAAGAPDPGRLPRGMPADLDAGIARPSGSSAPTSPATKPRCCAP